MLSRVAETIFWLGRYAERTNGMLQVLRTNYISSQDTATPFSWKPLLQLYGELTPEEIVGMELKGSHVLEYLIFDRYNGASVYNNVKQSRENARAIQDHITKEVWQCLNDFYHFIRDPALTQQIVSGDPVTALDSLLKHGLLLTGTIKNTLTRGEGYTYLHLGKFLERAVLTTDILRINLVQINFDLTERIELPALRYLLYSLLGFEIYMKTYKGTFNAQHALELIIYHRLFPHSLMYSHYQLNKYFERLKPESFPESYEAVDFLIGKTMNKVRYSNLQIDDPKAVNDFLMETRTELLEIANCLGKYYFGNT